MLCEFMPVFPIKPETEGEEHGFGTASHNSDADQIEVAEQDQHHDHDDLENRSANSVVQPPNINSGIKRHETRSSC